MFVKYKKENPRVFSAVIIFFVAIFLIPGWIKLVDFYKGHLLSSLREDISSELSYHANDFTNSINRRLALIEGLHSFVVIDTSPHRLENKFEIFVSALYKSTPGIRNFAASPGGIQTYVFPVELNKVTLGHNLLTDQRSSVQQGNKKLFSGQKTHIRGPINLRQGGQGLIITKAIFLDGDYKTGSFWGFISMAIDMLPVYQESGLSGEDKHLKIALKNDNWGVFIGDDDVFEKNPVLQHLSIGYEKWLIAGHPENGWNAEVDKSLSLFKAIITVIVLLVLLICYITILNRFSLETTVDNRTKELFENNATLAAEIKERKLIQEELLKQQYFLKKAQEIGQIGTWELDVLENKLAWTDENYRIFGIPIGTDLTYEVFLSCVHPDDREYVDKVLEAAFNKKPYDIEHRLLVDGKVKWVREKAELEFNEKNECVRRTGFTQDITKRKQAEDELAKYNRNLESLVKEQTAKLEEQVLELGEMNDLFVGREFRIKELKDKIKELELKMD